MTKPLHAIDYLSQPKKHPALPVCVLFGDESFLHREALLRLRRNVLGEGDGNFSLSVFEGRNTSLRDILGELATMAMFGGDRRLVVVEEADEFVTRYRPELEDYADQPSSTGVLVLQVKTWPGNTRLAKKVAAKGLTIECKSPASARLVRWLTSWSKKVHGIEITPGAVEILIEMIGPELGLLDQELAKLALSVDAQTSITPKTVRQMVGSWRAKTAWQMLDTALEGKVGETLVLLDRLLLAGENPIAILAQISASLRRFAAATRLILQSEATGHRTPLKTALQQAGFKPFLLEKAQRHLRLLGRNRGSQLYRWLLAADLDLKGASRVPARLVLERLLIQIASKGTR